MQSIDVLVREHELIQKALGLLTQAAVVTRRGEALPEGFGDWAIRFIRRYADACHHAKEEQFLFPLMEKRGVPRENGPIGCMLHEHEIGRECVRRMADALSRPGREALSDFAAAAEAYVSLLREHIFKENNILFVMAAQCMDPEDDAALMSRYAETAPEFGDCDPAKIEQEAARWAKLLGEAPLPIA